MTDLEIRILEEKDIEELIAFYNSVYGAHRTRAYFDWAFINGPFGKAVYVIAKDKTTDIIIGSQAAIPFDLVRKTKSAFKTAKSEDTLIHPDYRGQEISTKMYDLLFKECNAQGIAYLWGFSALDRPFLRAGFEIPCHIQQGYFPLSSIADSKAFFKKTKGASSLKDKLLINGLSQWATLNARWKQNKGSSLESFEVKINYGTPFISSALHLDQSDAFRKWRFVSHPAYEQSISYALVKGDVVLGQLDFSFQENEAQLIQSFFKEDLSSEDCIAFLHLVMEKLREEEMVMISTWCFDLNVENQRQLDLFKRAGFLVLNRGMHFVWKVLEKGEEIGVQTDEVLLSRGFGG